MADNVYDFDALVAAGTRYVTDDGTGQDWITLQTVRTISQAAINTGNYAVRIFLTTTTFQEGYAYAEWMQTDPFLVYTPVRFTGVIEIEVKRQATWGMSDKSRSRRACCLS
jgi:hypothetical protein